MRLEKEIATYRKKLPEMLAHEGKYVLIHGEQIDSYWDTYHDAIQTGYEKFGLQPFLVKQVFAIEPIRYFTGVIIPCR